MCGITGILCKNVDKKHVKKATEVITHRGPDYHNHYFNSGIGLGHQRLSIIDLSKNGRQPMLNDKENLCIAYNGEIYNFKEIKKELINKGKKFISTSDTEVILKAYEMWGSKSVEKFDGMFAYAIWDTKKKELFLARDRTGIKPLYYYSDNKKFVFGSEIKSLFEYEIKKELNKKIIYDYMNYQILIGEETLFKDIYSFPPGHYATIKKAKKGINKKIKRYFNINYSEKETNLQKASKKIKELLEESVKEQLVGDVPIGAFLSGGLDSSAIVTLASKFYDKKISTFTAGFDVYPKEIENAEFISKEIGTEQHNIVINSKKFIQSIPKLIYHYDQPISFASSIPLYHIAKLSKKKVKVVLTGEGADELMGGYRRYYLIKKALTINKRIPGTKIFGKIPEIIFKDPRYIKILKTAFNGLNYDYITGINSIISKEREKITLIKKDHPLQNNVKKLFNEKKASLLNKILYVDFNTYLVELLMKQDKMSMAASIESRVPFLSNKMIDYTSTLDNKLKLNGKIGKYVLRNSVKHILPKKVLEKKKIGFTVPLNLWFKKELQGYLKDNLNNKIVHEYFDKKYVNKLIEKQKKKNMSLQLWALLNFKLWHEKYFLK